MTLRARTNHLAIAILTSAAFSPAVAQQILASNAALEAAWTKLETQNLPLIEKLSATDPCANQAAIAERLAETRAAASKYFSVKGKTLQQSHDTAAAALNFLQKSWADMRAQRGDTPALVKTYEAALDEYRRTLGSLPPQEEESRLIYEKLIERAQAGLLTLRTALADAKAVDDLLQVSQEFLSNKVESARRYRQLFDVERQATELKYEAVLQRQEMACVSRSGPDVLRQLNRPAAAPDPLNGAWTYNSVRQQPGKPGNLKLQLKGSGSGIDGVLAASAIPKGLGLPPALEISFSGPKSSRLIFVWAGGGQSGSIELIPAGASLEVVWKTQKGVVLFDDLLAK